MAALIFQERLSSAAQPEHKLIRNAGSGALPQSHEKPVPKQSSRLDGYNVWPQTRTINVKSKKQNLQGPCQGHLVPSAQDHQAFHGQDHRGHAG